MTRREAAAHLTEVIPFNVKRWQAIGALVATLLGVYGTVRVAVRTEMVGVAEEVSSKAIAAHEREEASLYVRRESMASSDGLNDLKLTALQAQLDRFQGQLTDLKQAIHDTNALYLQLLQQQAEVARRDRDRDRRGG